MQSIYIHDSNSIALATQWRDYLRLCNNISASLDLYASMPLAVPNFPAAPECGGRQWTVLDEDQLATLAALVLIGRAKHAEAILEGAQRSTTLVPNALKAQLRTQLITTPGPLTWHRDGLLFEIISWVVARLTAQPNELISTPHLKSTQQGLDTIKIAFDTVTRALIRAVVHEQKCTERARAEFRDKVIPSFHDWRAHKRDNELVQAVTLLIERFNLSDAEHVRLYDRLVQDHPLTFQAALTVTPTPYETARCVTLFAGFTTVTPDIQDRLGDTRSRSATLGPGSPRSPNTCGTKSRRLMFDAATTALIQSAPPLSAVDPTLLPQEITRIYTELVVLRLRGSALADDEREALWRLKRIADIYEAAVDLGSDGTSRRAAAFVAATAHQILAGAPFSEYEQSRPLLEPDAIHPSIAAPLLFLIAEQNADAREAALPLRGIRSDNLLRSAVIESVYDLATERFEEILQRATRLRRARVASDGPWVNSAGDALYGLCWSGLVQFVSDLLGQPFPELEFARFVRAQEAFDRVVTLSSQQLDLGLDGPPLLSTFAGPRHLARLLRHLADDIAGSGIIGIEPPSGASRQFWQRWLEHRAKTKPVLWRNHRDALDAGILETGKSAVVVLPTGAGKTTLSELKVAATLARGKKVLFLVPTLALVDQLRDELADAFPQELGANMEVSADGDLNALIAGPELHSVEVITPERCLALLSHAADAIAEVGLIVFDECHLLSPKGGGKRSLDAMLCLLHALKRAPEADLLLLSAMLTNPSEFSEWIQENTSRPCVAYHNPWKPSRQARGILIYRRSDLQNIAITQNVIPYALFGLHQNWVASAPADTRLVQLSNEPVTLNRAAKGYATPNANGVANSLAVQAARANIKTIVFVQQADYAPSNAAKIAAQLPAPSALTTPEEVLWNAIVAEVGGPEFSLVQPDRRALPHNGDMIPQERRLAESLFKREDGATVIVATPTLAQGMNLPAHFALLAGDKRQDEEGRTSLEPHEILNAAGRAGRAGHLANGIVLLIPDPVTSFYVNGQPDPTSFNKLRVVLPSNDQCVPLEDPVTLLLDLIHTGQAPSPAVNYFASRIRAGEQPEDAVDRAIDMVRRSFAAFQARQAHTEAAFDQKLEALRSILEGSSANAEVVKIAASTGLPDSPLLAAQARFAANPSSIPSSILGWTDWIVDFFQSDQVSYQALLGDDAPIVNYVVRGKKKGGPPNAEEFSRLKKGLRAWMKGQPLREIELALGVPGNKLKCCPRARDLVLKLANRSLYLIGASLVEVARTVIAAQELTHEEPSVLETLPVAIRKGLDTPDKVAFAYRRPTVRSRVLIHRNFASTLGQPISTRGMNYATVLSHTTARLPLAAM